MYYNVTFKYCSIHPNFKHPPCDHPPFNSPTFTSEKLSTTSLAPCTTPVIVILLEPSWSEHKHGTQNSHKSKYVCPLSLQVHNLLRCKVLDRADSSFPQHSLSNHSTPDLDKAVQLYLPEGHPFLTFCANSNRICFAAFVAAQSTSTLLM